MLPSPQPLPPTPEFLNAASHLGIEFEPEDPTRLGAFLALMLETNKTHNLTGITDPDEAWMKHIFDALTLVPVLSSVGTERLSVIDIGSGGGVPALPLAIVLPEMRFTLVEATGKKVAFLREAANALGLKNVRVLQERAERLGQDHKNHRERHDIATARALGHLAVVAELCGPLVKQGGLVVAVKGGKAEQELGEAREAFATIGLRHAQTIDTPTGKLVVLDKPTKTPREYPRRDGEPSRVPIGLPRAAAARPTKA